MTCHLPRALPVFTLVVVFATATAAHAANGVRGVRAQLEGGPSEQRIALVVGNAAYPIGALRNAVNDAADMAQVLGEMGFRVALLRDVSQRAMDDAIERFARDLAHADVGLFYFAGHGVQGADGENYLVPIDAVLNLPDDIRYRTVPVGRVLSAMETAHAPTNVIILDACRDNPFPRPSRSLSRGLAAMQAINGSLIAYATAPGSVAADGTRRNGLYTEHLLRAMRQPGVPLEQVFKSVRIGVRNDTGGAQVPWETSSLTADFFFRPGDGTVTAAQLMPTRPPVAAATSPPMIASVPSEDVRQRTAPRRVHVEPDGPSRYVADFLKRQLAEHDAVVAPASDGATALTISMRSRVVNDDAYDTKLTRLTVAVTVRNRAGREVFADTYEATGSSASDYEAAAKDAAQVWAASARQRRLVESILDSGE